MAKTTNTLNTQLLKAHATGDTATMAALYQQAAQQMDAKGDEASAAFYYTQAYICALDAGSPKAADLDAWLRRHNRQ